MIPLLQALFDEIKHGDQEHQDWLRQKMEEFSSNNAFSQGVEDMVTESMEFTAFTNFKTAFLEHLATYEQDKPVLYMNDRVYTAKELAEEISYPTEQGLGLMIKVLNLTTDLLLRRKGKI